MTKKVLKTFKVEKDLWNTFAVICKDQDLSASQVIRSLIKNYISKHSQQTLC